MNSESRLLVEIWDTIGDQISKAQRVEVIISLFRSFQEYGIEPEQFEEAIEEDAYLKTAFEAVVEDFGNDPFSNDGEEEY